MKPREIEAQFQAFVQSRAIDVRAASTATGLDAKMRFYADLRADGCDVSADGDMLLFQWGTYDWGEGKHFEVDMTRQVILPDAVDDDALWQLHLTYRFAASADLLDLAAGGRWCSSPSELGSFEAFVRGTVAYSIAKDRQPNDVEVAYECAG